MEPAAREGEALIGAAFSGRSGSLDPWPERMLAAERSWDRRPPAISGAGASAWTGADADRYPEQDTETIRKTYV